MAPAPTPAPKSGGSGLKAKVGGVPIYVLGIAAAVVGVGYFYWRRSKAAAAAAASNSSAANTASNATTGAASTPYGPAGGGGIDPGTLQAILASQGAGATASASSANTPPTGEILSGGGYQPSGNNTGQSVQGLDGNNYQWISGNSIATLGAAGTPIYVQTTPGSFTPWNVNTYVPGTALYIQQPTAAA